MRIKTFSKLIESEVIKDHILNNSKVVIDGQNFFYNLYKNSGLQFIFGGEHDRYAEYVREHLRIFKKANVKCYFVFKGGHEDITKKFQSMKATDHIHGSEFVVGGVYDDIVLPITMKETYKQVLDKMGFDYVVCEFESKKEIIAFAQKHKCPIISFDVEFCFFGEPYIPYPSLSLRGTVLKCDLFMLDRFLQKYRLTEEKLAIFAVLTDQNIFPENNFLYLVKSLKIPLSNYKRNLGILSWLSRTSRENALAQIFRFNPEDKTKFLKEEITVKALIRRRETPGIPTEYLDSGNQIEFAEKDPLWFEKGVASKYIAIPLINLYRSATVLGSWAIADKEADDAMLLSLDIIKYAYNLLTNFQNKEFTFLSKLELQPMTVTSSVQKPNYEAIDSVFENGWSRLKALGLFEHFVNETLQGFDFEQLERLPKDARLLMIALVYFSGKKSADTSNEVYSVLLSYVALSAVLDIKGNNNTDLHLASKSLPDSNTDKKLITRTDKSTASDILKEYYSKVNDEEAEIIFEPKLIHPLVEFQHCLEYLNYLNKLCGSPYEPTVYSNTYNGTFVYKILHAINNENTGKGLDLLKIKLNPAPTVLAFLNGLIESYEETILTSAASSPLVPISQLKSSA